MTTRRSDRRVKMKKTPGSQKMTEHRNRAKRAGEYPRKAGSPRGQRHFVQLLICCGLFVTLVAIKLLLPAKMEVVNDRLSQVLHQNMDVHSVFSAVSKTFSGKEAGQDIFQAVFGAKEQTIEVECPVSFQLKQEPEAALHLLQQYRNQEIEQDEEKEQQETVAALAYIQYSNQNLPDHVSLGQEILDFDYCTPICGVLTSKFGYREHPVDGKQKFHYGVDLAADQGTAVSCFADGTVRAVGESSSYGKYCIVDHGRGFETLYAHCSSITASSGTDVRRGEKIGEVGATGIATGPHLHFELHRDGVYLNPIYYVET